MLTNLGLDKHPIPMVIYEFSFTLGLALHCEYLMKKNKILAIRFNWKRAIFFYSIFRTISICDTWFKFGNVLNNPLLGLHFQKTLKFKKQISVRKMCKSMFEHCFKLFAVARNRFEKKASGIIHIISLELYSYC